MRLRPLLPLAALAALTAFPTLAACGGSTASSAQGGDAGAGADGGNGGDGGDGGATVPAFVPAPVDGFVVHDGTLDTLLPSTSYGQCPGPCGINKDGRLARQDLLGGAPAALVSTLEVYFTGTPMVATPQLIAAPLSSGQLTLFDPKGQVLQTDGTYDERYGLRADGTYAYWVSTPIPSPTKGIVRSNGGAPTLVVPDVATSTWWDAVTIAGGQAYVAQSCVIGNEAGLWCDKAGIYATSLAGNGDLSLLLALPQSELPEAHYYLAGVEADESTLAWTIENGLADAFDVYATSVSSPTAPGKALLHVAGEAPGGAVLHGASLLVCSKDTHDPAAGGQLRRVSIADGTTTVLAKGGCTFPQVAGSDVYFLTWDGAVRRVPIE